MFTTLPVRSHGGGHSVGVPLQSLLCSENFGRNIQYKQSLVPVKMYFLRKS